MPCYRPGGCGPYEGLSCTECAASHPEYLQTRDPNTRMAAVQSAAATALAMHKELHTLIDQSGRAVRLRDADTVLADLMGIQGDEELTETGAALLTQMVQEPTEGSLKTFHTLTGVDVEEYCKTVADICAEQITAITGKDPLGTLYEVTLEVKTTVRLRDRGDADAVKSRFAVTGDLYAGAKDALQAAAARGRFEVASVKPVKTDK